MIDQLIRLLENAPDVKSIPELIADARYLEEKLSRKKDEPEPYITSELSSLEQVFKFNGKELPDPDPTMSARHKSPNSNVRIFSNG